MDRVQKGLMGRTPPWILVGGVGMILMALSSGIQPWAAAAAGAVLPADLAADAAAAHLFAQRTSPYGPAIRSVHETLTGLPVAFTLPYFPHPPFSLVLTSPFAFMPFQTAALAWFGVTMALLFVLAVLIRDAPLSAGQSRPRIGVGALWLLLLVWPPVLYNLEKGQWSVLVAVLLGISWHSLVAGQLRTGAVWAAVAASVKVFPVLLGVYLVIRSVRAATWFALTGILLLTIPLLWIGFDAFAAFVRESRLNLPYWESYPLVMFSIHGALTRAFVGGKWAEPLQHAPLLASILEIVLAAVLLGIACWTTFQARKGRMDQGASLLVWFTLLPLLNPLSMGHNGVLLALPIVVLARVLVITGEGWQRWSWALSLVLVSIPNQSVWRLAGLPSGPIEGVTIAAMPMWGTLLLFVVAVSVARAGSTVGSVSESAKIAFSPPAAHDFTAGHTASAQPFRRMRNG